MSKGKIYMGPSCQEHNIGVGDYGTEEYRTNLICDYAMPYLVRDFDVKRNKPNMTLAQIIADSNAFNPDIHVAIHTNAAANQNAKGCEVWAWFNRDGSFSTSQKLATCLYSEISAVTPWCDRGIKNGGAAGFAEITKTRAVAALIEIDFHTNVDAAKFIEEHPEVLGRAIAKGIYAYFNVPFYELIERFRLTADINGRGLLNDIVRDMQAKGVMPSINTL